MRLFVTAVVAFALVPAGCGASASSLRRAAAAVTGGSDEGRGARLGREPGRREQRGGGAAVLAPGADQRGAGAVPGAGQCWCLTPADVVKFHAQIPCSVKIVSLKGRGRYATAVFRLGDRVTSKCASAPGPDPTGWLSGVRFTIVRGKITAMQQMWFKPLGQAAIRWPGR